MEPTDVRELATQLGHYNLEVKASRKGWHGYCICGFSTPRVGEKNQAVEMLLGHIATVIRTYRRRGIAVPAGNRAS